MPKNEFVREQIKEKPRNKKKLVLHLLYMALCGIVFALAACAVLVIALPRIMDRPQEPVVAVDTETETATEEVTETETQPVEVAQPVETVEQGLSIEEYQKFQNELYAVGTECNRSIVTITGVGNDTDIFNNSYESEGSWSGVIIREESNRYLILTEYRIIRKASTIQVTFIDGTESQGTLVMADGNTGLAVLEVDKESIDQSTRDQLRVAVVNGYTPVRSGAVVLALGSPLGSTYSILTGNVTSTENEITTEDHNYTVYTTDIVGSEDGSGILINTSGEVIGIIIQQFGTEDSMNTLTAVKVSELMKLVDMLCDGKQIPYLGAHVSTVTDRLSEDYDIPKGVYIKSVSMDSPAMEAGLQSGDIIAQIGSKTVNTENAYGECIMNLEPEQTVRIVVKRMGAKDYREIAYEVTVGVLESR